MDCVTRFQVHRNQLHEGDVTRQIHSDIGSALETLALCTTPHVEMALTIVIHIVRSP